MAKALLFGLALCAGVLLTHAARPTPQLESWLGLEQGAASKEAEGELWALLIAGSAGWGNYRHQSDVAHAYQVLKKGGVPDERVVVMVYDDLAQNSENPRPGQLFNHPDGADVYAGLPKDYTGPQVNAANFLAVLEGNASAVHAGPHSTGRVIAAGPLDRVFVYFSDHGAPGILGMPAGAFLYADELHGAIRRRRRAGRFAEMVLYIEACESGSLFDGLLERDLRVYATTAANGRESSWGGMDPAPPAEFSTCLGDLYSVAWLEDADANDLRAETLRKQYHRVRARASNNFTYVQGSHVMRYGALDMDEEAAARWEGVLNDGSQAGGGLAAGAPWTPLQAVLQRDADLLPLAVKARRGSGTPAGEDARRQLAAALAARRAVDDGVRRAVRALAHSSNALGGAVAAHGGVEAAAEALCASAEALPRPEGAALVDDWQCLRGMVAAWGAACGELDQYGMRHSRAFANLCNAGVPPAALGAAAAAACAEAATA